MTRHLHIDAFSGVSGDMFLGALVDAGVPLRTLEKGLKALDIKGYRLCEQQVIRNSI
ncbi:MAG: TIGR00299 family protein, partial [Nitrospirae bacterium CG_4_9_14_3_um_filter_51_5]